MKGEPSSFPGGSFLLALLLSYIATWAALKCGFFIFPPKTIDTRPTTNQLWKLFVFFIAVSLLLVPLIVRLTAKAFFPTAVLSNQLGWLQVISLLFSLAILVFYCLRFQRDVFLPLIKGNQNRFSFKKMAEDMKWGVLALVFAIPVVQAVHIFLGAATKYFWGSNGVEQSAVKQLKNVLDQPLLFVALALVVSFIVPFLEELLFRGYLQSWMGRKMKRRYAILLSSFIFACFHYSSSQGIGNIELIGSLFVLSCYLGIVFERQRSIWAPFTLHALFNFTSASLIFLGQS